MRTLEDAERELRVAKDQLAEIDRLSECQDKAIISADEALVYLSNRLLVKTSSTFGDLAKAAPWLADRIGEGHEWDNMSVCQQRDWVIQQAAERIKELAQRCEAMYKLLHGLERFEIEDNPDDINWPEIQRVLRAEEALAAKEEKS